MPVHGDTVHISDMSKTEQHSEHMQQCELFPLSPEMTKNVPKY